MKKTIIFIDSGDTLIDESTEIRDSRGIVQTAELIPGARELLETLHKEGYRIAMVADGYAESFRNMYTCLELNHCFEQRIYSSDVGEEKPSNKMFQLAMEAMGLTDADKAHILMVGNNISRDILGANQFGITSVLLDWTPRYSMTPCCEAEMPDYIIHQPTDLLELVCHLEEKENNPTLIQR